MRPVAVRLRPSVLSPLVLLLPLLGWSAAPATGAPASGASPSGAPGPGARAAPAGATGVPAGTPDVLLADQASRRVLRLDGRRREWGPAAVRWAFSPVGDARYADLEPERSWVYPDEAKLRVWRGRTYVLLTASYGFAAVVAYPGGGRHWGAALSPGGIADNPHSIELLPNGDVAVAASTGGLVRLYAASRGPAGVPYTSYPLADAHGLRWDARLRVLWALGGDRLVALRPEPGPAGGAPVLTRLLEVPLPERGGHDLGQVAGDTGRLWVSTGKAVYQYVKSTGEFVRDFPGAAGISRADVKSVGDDPGTGQVLSTVPEPGLPETWWTRTAAVHRPEGAYRFEGGGIYKARWWRAGN
ncbi:DUF6528 family protein [Streptomyces sp. LP05-1]|uniref:DUF6528 family protein n=1 Tax=Streptomyces pyxinae TaxID=2970734 RepID=A0ABT2CPF5_9ACTN|nr:DUF6528 family protein [Streptomyces sp. LP05-1]MCS0639327.1 DUF6528 family protein [Streptomyces sp. LP05-1]